MRISLQIEKVICLPYIRSMTNEREHNRKCWDTLVDEGNEWTIAFDAAKIDAVRGGELLLLLTPNKHVPADWYPTLTDTPTLCLATGGGQQAPALAAAGAKVTTIDNSPKQLAQDQLVAQREGLQLETVLGDMADLSAFADGQFGLIFHACSNCFCKDILPVWKEAYRVLRPGGVLLSGFTNPIRFAINDEDHDRNHLQITRKLPWSGIDDRSPAEIDALTHDGDGLLQFGHTLQDQIGGQLAAGFHMTAMFEDNFDRPDEADPISNYMDTFVATRSIKPL